VPEETENSNCCPQADGGPGARGAQSGESCTGTDVNTRSSSRIKRPLSPGGTPQDAQSQVKHTKKPQAPNGSAQGNRKKHNIPVKDLLRFKQPHGGFHSTLVRNTKGFTG